MATKPVSKSWDDIKMLMAALAVATTLGLWNLLSIMDQQNTAQKTSNGQNAVPIVVENTTQPVFQGKILLGGQPPSQNVVIVRTRPGQSQNGQQPAPVTQTRSS
jgi:hypothetical protein